MLSRLSFFRPTEDGASDENKTSASPLELISGPYTKTVYAWRQEVRYLNNHIKTATLQLNTLEEKLNAPHDTRRLHYCIYRKQREIKFCQLRLDILARRLTRQKASLIEFSTQEIQTDLSRAMGLLR